MNKPELFNKTIAILVKAYFKETLQKGEQCGCAIGNLIAANLGYNVVTTKYSIYWLNDMNDGSIPPLWQYVHENGEYRELSPQSYFDIGAAQLKSTGYQPYETILIERAFEFPYDWRYHDIKYHDDANDDAPIFDRLMAVVDCLVQIHEGSEIEAEETKLLFAK